MKALFLAVLGSFMIFLCPAPPISPKPIPFRLYSLESASPASRHHISAGSSQAPKGHHRWRTPRARSKGRCKAPWWLGPLGISPFLSKAWVLAVPRVPRGPKKGWLIWLLKIIKVCAFLFLDHKICHAHMTWLAWMIMEEIASLAAIKCWDQGLGGTSHYGWNLWHLK